METWLNDLKLSAVEPGNDEPATIANIQHCQDEINELVKKEKKLSAIKAKCDHLGDEHSDVKPLTAALSDQLTKTIELIRLQLIKSKEIIYILETHLIELREQAAAKAAATPTPSDGTIDSGPMPEHEPPQFEQRFEVETQTSESIQLPRPIHSVETVECGAQTRDTKPTENIFVTQTQSEGHETIKFESAPNPNVEEYTEDVYVDAKYKQPNEPHKATELILRNVPHTSFETVFVEPDNTTTEVVVDADGRKQIIVRKVTRTVQQQQIIEQKQQHTKIESLIGPDNQPIEQNVSQSSTEDQSVITSVSDGKRSKTTKTKTTKITHATGETPDQLVVQEVIEKPTTTEVITSDTPPQQQQIVIGGVPHIEQSSVQTVMHHVTQRIIRRKKKIIRKVTIIDGVEHVTEEVIEEPEEVEITEDEMPGVNINVTQFIGDTPIVELAAEDEPIVQIEREIINEPVIVDETVKSPPQPTPPSSSSAASSNQNQGKKVRASSKQVKEEQNTQVLDFEASAPVDLVEHAPVVAELPHTAAICDVNIVQLPAKQTIEIDNTNLVQSPVAIENITDIWPTNEPPVVSLPSHDTSPHESITIHSESIGDSVPSEKIWPIDDKTGHPFTLETYTFEQTQVPLATVDETKPTETVVISEEISHSKPEVEPTPSEPVSQQTIEKVIETPKQSPTEGSISITEKIETVPEQTLEIEIVKTPPQLIQSVEITETTSQSLPLVESEPMQKDSDHSEHVSERSSVSPESETSSKTFTVEKDEGKKKKKSKKGFIMSLFKKGKKTPPVDEKESVEVQQQITVDIEKKESPLELVETSKPHQETVESVEIVEVPPEEPKPDQSALFIEQEKYDVQVIDAPKPSAPEPEPVLQIQDVQIDIESQKAKEKTSEPSPSEKSSKTISIEKDKKSKKKKKPKKGSSSEGDTEPKDQPEKPTTSAVVVEIVKTAVKPSEPSIDDVDGQNKEIAIVKTQEIVIEQPPIDPVIVVDVPQAAASVEIIEPEVAEPPAEEPKPKAKPIDVRSVTQLFIENELNVSDGTTRTVKLTMSPQEPLSPGSVQVKMQKVETIEQQPKINVNLTEERLHSEPIDASVAASTDLHVTDDDNTISEKMEMPEIETTPIPATESIGKISPDESYKSISELDGPVKVIEESVISPASDSPKALGAEIVIATEILEEQHIEDAHQQTDPIHFDDKVSVSKPVESSTKSIQTTPEPQRVFVDEELQTTPTKQQILTDIEVQTSPIAMTPDTTTVEKVVTIHEEVCTLFSLCILNVSISL